MSERDYLSVLYFTNDTFPQTKVMVGGTLSALRCPNPHHGSQVFKKDNRHTAPGSTLTQQGLNPQWKTRGHISTLLLSALICECGGL